MNESPTTPTAAISRNIERFQPLPTGEGAEALAPQSIKKPLKAAIRAIGAMIFDGINMTIKSPWSVPRTMYEGKDPGGWGLVYIGTVPVAAALAALVALAAGLPLVAGAVAVWGLGGPAWYISRWIFDVVGGELKKSFDIRFQRFLQQEERQPLKQLSELAQTTAELAKAGADEKELEEVIERHIRRRLQRRKPG